MNPLSILLTAAAVGFASGLRAFTPLAIISWLSSLGWIGLNGSRLWFLGTTEGALVASALALIELIGDKLPITPARIQMGPLIARILIGGMAAGAIAIAGGQSFAAGAITGAVAAVAGAYAGYHLRKAIVSRLKVADLLVALVEDLIAIGGTLALLAFFFGKPS